MPLAGNIGSSFYFNIIYNECAKLNYNVNKLALTLPLTTPSDIFKDLKGS